MKAWTYERYGEPDVMRLHNVPAPQPAEGEVRVRVHATSLNASDMEFLRAKPAYIRLFGPLRPKVSILGSDVAGVVEAVGPGVERLQVGDAVCADLMFHGWGGLAELVCAPEDRWARKPPDVPFEVAAAVPQAGVVALQVIEQGAVEAGHRVAINGAGGGAGTFAIQLAKRLGAEVTAVDRGDKAALMRALGADRVVDYTREDFTADGARYDRIVDFVAHRSLFDHRRALTPSGRYLVVGGTVPRLLQLVVVGGLLSSVGRRKTAMFTHEQKVEDVERLLAMVERGEVVPQIGHRFPLAEADDAMRVLTEGRSLGKVVVTVIED